MIVINNGTVVTMDDAGSVLFGGHVVIDGDRIVAVGDGRYTADGGADEIDASGMVVMPGLVDLHFHTSVGKGFGDHLALRESLEEFWYPSIRALDAESAYWAAAASYVEAIKCGVTAVNDMYRRLPDLARAAADVGIRAVLSNDVALAEHRLDTLEDSRAAYEAVHGAGDGLVSVNVGIEWLPLASPGLLADARALADELGTGIHVHLNESLEEVETVKRQFGARPTELAYYAGLLGPDCVAAHCVWLSDAEIAMLRETGTHVSHNPISNAKLGNGIARLPELLAAGVNVGLGHDAAESSNSCDIFEVMKFAAVIHRGARSDATLQPAPEILKMATRNGSTALGHNAGRLSAGRLADVILVDTRNFAFTPLDDRNAHQLYSHLVYSATGSAVDTTIVNGKVVMRGREVTTLDEAQVIREANRALLRIVKEIGWDTSAQPLPTFA